MTSEDEKIETCRVAMKAALEAIQDYCGAEGTSGRAVIVEGPLRIEIPDELYNVLDSYRDEKWKFSTLYSFLLTKDTVMDMARQICALQGDTSMDCRDYAVRGLVYKIVTNEDLEPWIGTIDPGELEKQYNRWKLPKRE